MSKDFSENDIDLGMRLQNLEKKPVIGAAYRFGRWLWAGDPSSSHVWVNWMELESVQKHGEDNLGLIPTDSNSEAGKAPRTYRKAAVFAAAAAAVGDVFADHGYDGMPGVMYEYEGRMYGGALPGRRFGELDASDAEHGYRLAAAAMRQGKAALRGGLVVLYDRHAVIPSGMHLQDQLVPTREMAVRYTDVPMV